MKTYLSTLLLATAALLSPLLAQLPVATTSSMEVVPRAGGSTDYGVRSSMKINPVTGHPGIAHFDRGAGKLIYTAWNGAAWEELVVSTFTRQAGADYFYCSLAYDAAGVPNIAFFDREQDNLKFARPNATGTAFVTELVDDVSYFGTAGRYCALTFAPNGKAYLSYYHNEVNFEDQNNPDQETVITSELRVATRSTNGVWSIATVDGPAGIDVGHHTALDVTATGYPVVSYLDVTHQNLKVAYFNGTSWLTRSLDSAIECTAITSRPVPNGGVEIVYVWKDLNPNHLMIGSSTIFTTGPLNGVIFGFTSRTIETDTIARDPSIAVDREGNPVVSYIDTLSGILRINHNIGYSKSKNSQVTGVNEGAWSSLAIGPDGMVSVCCTARNPSQLKYIRLTGWCVQSVNTEAKTQCFPSLAYGSDGLPAISYFHPDPLIPTESRLKLAKRASRDLPGWSFTDLALLSDANGIDHTSSLKPNIRGGLTPVFSRGSNVSFVKSPEANRVYYPSSSVGADTLTATSYSSGGVLIYKSDIPSFFNGPIFGENTPDDDFYDWLDWPPPIVNSYNIDTDINSNHIYHSTLKHNTQGFPTVSYSTSQHALKFAELKTDGNWHLQTIPGAQARSDYPTSLSYNLNGLPAICFSFFGLSYAERGFSGNWQVQSIDSVASAVTFHSFTHGPNGQPRVCYTDQSSLKIKYAERRIDGTWLVQIVDNSPYESWGCSLSNSPQGRPTISYVAANNLGLKFAERVISPVGLGPEIPFKLMHFAHSIRTSTDQSNKRTFLSWQGSPSSQYRVDLSSDMSPGSWLVAKDNIYALDGMTFSRTRSSHNQADPLLNKGFFRVLRK
jgi:hypothetical protein